MSFASANTVENRRWRASLAIVAEGTKELVMGSTRYRLSPGHYTVTPVPLPLVSRVAHAPFSCLLIGIDPVTLRAVAAEMDPRDEDAEALHPGIFVGEVCERMQDAAVRLSQQFESREAGAVVGPACIRELLFHVLRGPNGAAIRQFVRLGSEAHRIAAIVHQIETKLAARLNIDALAADAHVSRTVFFEQFRRVTSLSPVQYQKRLRLLEAQRLMVEESTTAEDSAYRVGYQSPSQFSREYARMFGEAPRTNASRLRSAPRPPTSRV